MDHPQFKYEDDSDLHDRVLFECCYYEPHEAVEVLEKLLAEYKER